LFNLIDERDSEDQHLEIGYIVLLMFGRTKFRNVQDFQIKSTI